jgi:Zn-dependent metalloprotease
MIKLKHMLFRRKFSSKRSALAAGISMTLAIVCWMVLMVPAPALSAPDNAAAAWAAADMKIVRNPSTGAVSFLSTSKGLDSGASATALRATPEATVATFLSRYQKFLGMFNATKELSFKKSSVDRLGMTHIKLQQIHKGITVFGAEVRLHFFADGSRLRALNGNFIPYLAIRKRPSLDSDAAIDIVRGIQEGGDLWDEPVLQIYSGHIDRFVSGNHLAWMVRIFDITEPSRNLYVVDAHTGEVLTSYNELPNGRVRQIYDAGHVFTIPGTLVRSEGDGPTGDSDVDEAYDYLGDTYDYFFDSFGRDSFDGVGSTLKATVHYGLNWPNAGWIGRPINQMVFGDNFTVDDVTAHEVAHGVTEYTADLIYQNESGALNESFSDIFGEFVDQINGAGNDSPLVKWLMGEDIPGIGAIRDMSNPPAYGDPDRTSTFVCTSSDNGGVHTNSGIPNKAAFLMVDGGSFNGRTVTGIGRVKTGLVQYRALSVYLSMSSGFLNYYNAIKTACSDLVTSGDLTASDCDEVDEALLAVELNIAPNCGGGWSLIYPTLVDTPSDLDDLRRYRDEVMATSIRGRLYTRLLYKSSEKALKVLQDNPRLKRRAARLISRNKAAIEEVLAGGEGVLHNSNQIIAFLGAYARKSPPGLKFFAKMVKIAMQKHKKRGKPFLGFRLE